MEALGWTDVARRIATDDEGKWDRNVLGADVMVTEAGILQLKNGSEGGELFNVSDLATSQLCERLSIPTTYFRRLPPAMKATVANFDLARLNDKTFLLRGKEAHVRAFLSGGYIAYNNGDIAETVAELLRSASIHVKSFVLEETHCFMKIVSEQVVEPAAGLKAGIMIGNSEVGMGSVSVEPFVFRKACTNDLVVTQEKAFRHAHIHFTPNEMKRRLAEAIGDGFLVASQILDTFLKTREELIPDPLAAIRKIAEDRKMSQKLTDEVVVRYVAESEPNRFGVINAFTAAAQTLAPLQRIEMERFAGTLLIASL